MSFFVITKILLKSLLAKPATRRYPFVPRKYFPNTRGKITINIANCIFCGLCQRKCPTQAIVVSKEEKDWQIDRMRCVICGYCVDLCPKKCLTMDNQYFPPNVVKKKEDFKNA